MSTSTIPPEVHDTTYITDLGLDFLERHVTVTEYSGTPFLCHISYVDPHDPYDPPEPYASIFDPDDMSDALPAEWMKEEIATLAKEHKCLAFDQCVYGKPEVVRQLRALYHGQLRFMDDQINRVVDFLKDHGLWENTILVFTTDHGEMLGDHGLITKGLKHYDAGIRCPLIVAGGGLPQGVNRGLVCSLDFFPTFCDWAGIPDEDRPPLEGRSFADALNEDRWDAVSVALGHVESVVSEDGWRLTRFVEDDKGQLFNLNDDPGEQHNLYNDPAVIGKKIELLEKLVRVTNYGRRERHYRNLPVLEDRKLDIQVDKVVGTRRRYTLPLNPALDGSLGSNPAPSASSNHPSSKGTAK